MVQTVVAAVFVTFGLVHAKLGTRGLPRTLNSFEDCLTGNDCVTKMHPEEFCTPNEAGTEGKCTNLDTGQEANLNGFGKVECEPGSYANLEETLYRCVQCPKGTFEHEEGESECDPCTPGHYSDTTGYTGFLCTEGTFDRLRNEPICVALRR